MSSDLAGLREDPPEGSEPRPKRRKVGEKGLSVSLCLYKSFRYAVEAQWRVMVCTKAVFTFQYLFDPMPEDIYFQARLRRSGGVQYSILASIIDSPFIYTIEKNRPTHGRSECLVWPCVDWQCLPDQESLLNQGRRSLDVHLLADVIIYTSHPASISRASNASKLGFHLESQAKTRDFD